MLYSQNTAGKKYDSLTLFLCPKDFFFNLTFLSFINVIYGERGSQRKKKNHIQTFTPKILKASKHLGPVFYLKG